MSKRKGGLLALLILVATLMGGMATVATNAAGPHPVQTIIYPDASFQDGAHWIVKISFRGVDTFKDLGDACPKTSGEIANLIGGNSSKWSMPDPNFRNWVYADKGNPVNMIQPGFGEFDVWLNGGPRTVTTAGPISESQDNATFKCGGNGVTTQVLIPNVTRSDPPPPVPTSGEARCPTSPSDAASLLSRGQGSWTDLGTQPWDGFRKWKFTSSVPADLDYWGFGSYDWWKEGNGLRRALQAVDTATYNCDE